MHVLIQAIGTEARDMANRKLFGPPSDRKTLNLQQLGDSSSHLIDLTVEAWTRMKEEDRFSYLEDLNKTYHTYVDEFYQLANDCVDRYDSATNNYARWRRIIIIGTGAVAIINLLAANYSLSKWSKNVLPITAAIAALALTVLANLESFFNFAIRAQAYRESREMFLDAARESQRVWEVYVAPFGSAVDGCANAVELYRRVVALDRELRSKFKELTKTKDSGKGAGSDGH